MTNAALMSRPVEDKMETKISQIRAAWAQGNKQKALLIAAKFPRLGAERKVITTAASAILCPGFYVSMGKVPAELINEGFTALQNKYDL